VVTVFETASGLGKRALSYNHNMLDRRLSIIAFFLALSAAANAESPSEVPRCDANTSSYAAAAFNFYVESVKSKCHSDFGGQNIVAEVVGKGTCNLSGSGFEGKVGIMVSLLDRETIIALAALPKGTRMLGFFEILERDVGIFKVSVFDSWVHHYDGGLKGGGCSRDILVVDENKDGVPEEVRLAEGRNGVCA